MKFPLLTITLGRPTSPSAEPEKKEEPKKESGKGITTSMPSFGPVEAATVFDQDGEAWRTYIHRNWLEKRCGAAGRHVRVPIRFRRLVGILIGLVGGLVTGSVVSMVLLVGGVFPASSFWLILISGASLGMVLCAILPGWWLGPALFKTRIEWHLRRIWAIVDGVPKRAVVPIEHDTYIGSKFQGEIETKKRADGRVELIIPDVLGILSAHALHSMSHAKAFAKMWLTEHQKGMQKILAGSLLTIAVSSLLIMVLVGYALLHEEDNASPPAKPLTTQPAITTQPGEATVGK